MITLEINSRKKKVTIKECITRILQIPGRSARLSRDYFRPILPRADEYVWVDDGVVYIGYTRKHAYCHIYLHHNEKALPPRTVVVFFFDTQHENEKVAHSTFNEYGASPTPHDTH